MIESLNFEQLKRTLITDSVIIEQTEDIAAKAVDDHLIAKNKRLWKPYQLVPFGKLEETPVLPDELLSAIHINSLTEDNLPHYTATIKRVTGDPIHVKKGSGEALHAWNGIWTSEEDLHGEVIDRFIEHTGIFDLDSTYEARRQLIALGEVPEPRNIAELFIYTAIQEDATRRAHVSVAGLVGNVGNGSKTFSSVAGDEAGHHRFYTKMSAAVREFSPDDFTVAAASATRNFVMPGKGIDGFEEHSMMIEQADIFTRADVAKSIAQVAKSWSLETLVDDVKSDEAKTAYQALMKTLSTYEKISKREIRLSTNAAPVRWEDGRAIILIRTP